MRKRIAALAFVLLASALKLLGVPTLTTGIVLVVVLLAAPLVWFVVRRHYGFPGFVDRQAAKARRAAKAEREREPAGQDAGGPSGH